MHQENVYRGLWVNYVKLNWISTLELLFGKGKKIVVKKSQNKL